MGDPHIMLPTIVVGYLRLITPTIIVGTRIIKNPRHYRGYVKLWAFTGFHLIRSPLTL